MTELSKLEERNKKRRSRRWKRRARIAAPFAAIPLLLTTLLLSVDFIEYAPQKPKPAVVSKPAVEQKPRVQPSLAARSAIATSAVVKRDILGQYAPDVFAPKKADSEEADEDVDAKPRVLPLEAQLGPDTPRR